MPEKDDGEDKSSPESAEFTSTCLRLLQSARSSPTQSPLRTLCHCLVHQLVKGDRRCDGSINCFLELWFTFCQYLRESWDESRELAGIEGTPNLSHCLLQQKLQMLQYCIGVRKKRHARLDAAPNAAIEDEFYDAEEEFSDEKAQAGEELGQAKGVSHLMEPFQRLLKHPNRGIAIPLTQASKEKVALHNSGLNSANSRSPDQ